MKKMNMEKRFWNMELQLFAGDGGDEDNETDSDDDSEDELDDEDDSEDDPDEKKFSQREVDDVVKKRLAREKRKWQREQKKNTSKRTSGTDKKEEDESEEEDARIQEAEAKASELELKWTCLEHDVKKDCVDDVLALAKVHVSKDESLDIEDAIDKVLEKYPQFKEDGEGKEQKKSWDRGIIKVQRARKL